MPPVSGRHGYIGPNQFEPFPSRGMKPSNSPSSTGSLSSSDNARVSPASADFAMRIPPGKYNTSPSRDYHSDKDVRMHTRTNFTKSYVPPVVASSPGRKGNPSPRYTTNPFDEDDDAPDDEIRHRTVRTLRPNRYYATTDDVPTIPARPEAYVSETDESTMYNGTRSQESLETRSQESSQVAYVPPFVSNDETRSQESSQAVAYEPPFVSNDDMEARHAEDVKNSPTRSYGKEARHAEEVKNSPIPSYANEAPSRVEEVKTFPMPSPQERRRQRRKDKRSRIKPRSDDAPVSDIDRFEREAQGEWSKSVGDEMEYYSAGDVADETEEYQEFGDGSNIDDPKTTAPVSILRRGASAKSSDDDSLFDFEGRNKEKGSIRKGARKDSSRRGRRPRRQTQKADDEESLEQDYGVVRQRSSSLQERTQQAWTFRSQRSYSVEKSDSNKRDGVQFEQTDTVHHFNDDETHATAQTSHSMNSMYTKSPESEAEDLIKDIFFIGSGIASNPGRRKLKYQPSYKRDLQKFKAETAAEDGTLEGTLDDTTLGTTDDVTLNTLDNETTAYTADDVSLETSPRKSDGIGCSSLDPVKNVVKTQEEDPLSVVWSFFETVSAVIGLTPSTEEEPEKDAPKNDNDSPVKKKAPATKEAPAMKNAPAMKEAPAKKEAPVTVEDPAKMEVPTKMEVPSPKEVPTKKQKPSKMKEVLKTREAPEMAPSSSDEFFVRKAVDDNQGSFTGDVMGYLFGANAPAAAAADKEMDKKDVSSTASMTTSSTPLEEDPRLEELALHAVRAKHELHDMKFDESVTIDIVNDIKFSLVRMALPLGILFHENDGGCWITKVFPDGNAAKVGGVEVGDQLAAVNGISAIMLRVDQICTLITEAPNPKNIELTFLRYVGGLHPLQLNDSEVQEQFEVVNTEPQPKKGPPRKVQSLRPKSNAHGFEAKQTRLTTRDKTFLDPKRGTSLESRNKSSQQFSSKLSPESKRKFKIFGRGKKN